LESNGQEVRKWFRNITSLLNSTEAASALEKNKVYAITDKDILASISNFTAKLQARLTKHQNGEIAHEAEINQLNEEIRQAKLAKNSI
jgi:hypothetical protein